LLGQFRLQTELHKQTKDSILLISERTKFFAEDLKRLQDNSAKQLQHLTGIEINTYKLHKIETDIAGMKRGIDELTTKGIKLKS
jgi:hypothetical protein